MGERIKEILIVEDPERPGFYSVQRGRRSGKIIRSDLREHDALLLAKQIKADTATRVVQVERDGYRTDVTKYLSRVR